MLTNLYVKNLALIEEADINFDSGLNILTGETGAGKSIILGSVNIALGAKASADIIRNNAEYALTELVFHIEDSETVGKLKILGIEELDDNEVIISRKITPTRSQIKINGMNFTSAQVRKIAGLLINIHGQHDNQLLLNESSHIQIVDSFAADEINPVLENYLKTYKTYTSLKRQLSEMTADSEARQREISFIEFEVNEITAAKLVSGEDEELEASFKKMNNSQKIMEDISLAQKLINGDDNNIQDMLSMAVKSIINAASYDDNLLELSDSVSTAEDLISQISMQLSDYMDEFSFDEADYYAISNRLDLINSFKLKYGKTIDDILEYCNKRAQRLDDLYNYDERLKNLNEELSAEENKLCELADRLTAIRTDAANKLCVLISEGLKELNFLNSEFMPQFSKSDSYTPIGNDEMYFCISTNIGEKPKPLSKIASGGELSRIMLAIKSIVAVKNEARSLIFDEIDAGISGRTAQMVAAKLKKLSKDSQIICITHLPQIAAMADTHYLIEKNAANDSTVTTISRLTNEASVNELARLLGGSSITEAVMSNAREMKALAMETV